MTRKELLLFPPRASKKARWLFVMESSDRPRAWKAGCLDGASQWRARIFGQLRDGCGEGEGREAMRDAVKQRATMIEHLENARALANELHDPITEYLVERALDGARAGLVRGMEGEVQ